MLYMFFIAFLLQNDRWNVFSLNCVLYTFIYFFFQKILAPEPFGLENAVFIALEFSCEAEAHVNAELPAAHASLYTLESIWDTL